MDYFAVGGRPFLSRFPPHLPGIFNPGQLIARQQELYGAQPQGEPPAEEGAGAVSSSSPGYGRAEAAYAQHFSGGYGPPSPTAAGEGLQGGYYAPWAPPAPEPAPRAAAAPSARAAEASYHSSPEAVGVPAREPDEDIPEAVPEVVAATVQAPKALHTGFDYHEVARWEESRFQFVRKVQDATRNRGQVLLMRDVHSDTLVAVKQMPNRWVRNCHFEFVIEHPAETEMPWQDLGCVRFLNGIGYDYVCQLLGVYRDDQHTYVVTSFAAEGDLFSWCEDGVAPGHKREICVQPLARQILQSVQQLHDYSIVHRDLSLENILLEKLDDESLKIRVIDFSMASTSRMFRNCVRGKASYQAPELHMDGEYDAFLSDAFSLGVTLYAVLLKDYPWLSTRPGGCKCFEYVRKHGFRSYLAKRKLRNSTSRVTDFMSEPLIQLLEGLLALDPAQRLTLGEAAWATSGRRSVWDEPWVHEGPGEPFGTGD